MKPAYSPVLFPTRPLAHAVPWTQHEIAVFLFVTAAVYYIGVSLYD